MNNLIPGVIQFEGYRLIDAQYHCNAGFEFSSLEDGDMKFNFSKSHMSLSDNRMQLNLRGCVFYSNSEEYDSAPYKISVEIAGIFSSDTEFDKKWENNALAILFPYVRSIISCLTSQSGRSTIVLPTVNIVKMFEEVE